MEKIIYKNYKEPLKRFTKGYGYIGTVATRVSDGKIQCAYCGEFYDTVSTTHIRSCTNGKIESLAQYKKELGLSMGTSLISDKRRDQLRLSYLRNSKVSKHYIPFTEEQLNKSRYRSMKTNRGRRWKKTAEYKNKMGTCPDQLMQKIKDLAEVLERVPSKTEFVKRYGGKYVGAIYTTFGSYPEAVRRAGFKPLSDERLEKYEVENLLEMLRAFYKERGRTPVYSDMNGRDLPVWKTFRKKFGSMNEMREMAGIPGLYQTADQVAVEVK